MRHDLLPVCPPPTRFAPQFYCFFSLQDVGIWLETDWYRKQAVIKEIKNVSYAFESTDVQVRKDFFRCLAVSHIVSWMTFVPRHYRALDATATGHALRLFDAAQCHAEIVPCLSTLPPCRPALLFGLFCCSYKVLVKLCIHRPALLCGFSVASTYYRQTVHS